MEAKTALVTLALSRRHVRLTEMSGDACRLNYTHRHTNWRAP